MSPIERQYEYTPRWTSIVLGAAFFGACAVGYAYIADTSDRGLVVNGILHLSRDGATIFYWALCAVCLTFVASSVLMTVYRITHRQRIAFTRDAVILPGSGWSPREYTLRYDEIKALRTLEFKSLRYLYVYSDDGMRYTLVSEFLSTSDLFEEVRAQLDRRIETAKQGERLRPNQ